MSLSHPCVILYLNGYLKANVNKGKPQNKIEQVKKDTQLRKMCAEFRKRVQSFCENGQNLKHIFFPHLSKK